MEQWEWGIPLNENALQRRSTEAGAKHAQSRRKVYSRQNGKSVEQTKKEQFKILESGENSENWRCRTSVTDMGPGGLGWPVKVLKAVLRHSELIFSATVSHPDI